MSHIGNLLAIGVGAVALGTMMNTVPDYNASFQPIAVSADSENLADARLFKAKLLSLKTADVISFVQFGKEVSRDTSAVFLVAELSITGQSESRYLRAIWRGTTGRQYSQSTRTEDAPHELSGARFEPGLTDRVIAIFELPPDEIVGGRLGVLPRGVAVGDSIVHFAIADTMPEKHALLRLEP